MATVPAKVASRITAGLKKFQPILSSAKTRDVGEADTVTIIKDLLNEVFGYDKYAEITSEHAIRSTFCDLAIRIDNTLAVLIEVKAIGLDLKDNHIKQATDYAANQGCDWVVLSNGIVWRVYKVLFSKPIEHELVLELNLMELSPRNEAHIELCWLLAKEGWQKARLGEYHSQRQALSRFSIAAVILSEPVLDVIRRELRRLSPDAKIHNDEIVEVLSTEVLKREVLDGEKADGARRMVNRAAKKALRSASPKAGAELVAAAVAATVEAQET
jgi:predicted type IV restriction endonuclease